MRASLDTAELTAVLIVERRLGHELEQKLEDNCAEDNPKTSTSRIDRIAKAFCMAEEENDLILTIFFQEYEEIYKDFLIVILIVLLTGFSLDFHAFIQEMIEKTYVL